MGADGSWGVMPGGVAVADNYATKEYVDESIANAVNAEFRLRESNPALKEAWERYQVLLKLMQDNK